MLERRRRDLKGVAPQRTSITLWCLLQQSFFKGEEIVAAVIEVLDFLIFLDFSDGFFPMIFEQFFLDLSDGLFPIRSSWNECSPIYKPLVAI